MRTVGIVYPAEAATLHTGSAVPPAAEQEQEQEQQEQEQEQQEEQPKGRKKKG